MAIYQECLDIDVSKVKTKTFHTNITNNVQNIISRSDIQKGVVLVHTLHTTTALIKHTEKNNRFTGFLVQEDEPLLMEDLSHFLNSRIEKGIDLLPRIIENKKEIANILPGEILEEALEIMTSRLKPAHGYKHDDFEIRVANMGPNERKNAEAHLKAAMLKECVLWSFSRGRLNLGIWQSILFWDFDPIGRKKRTINIMVLGE